MPEFSLLSLANFSRFEADILRSEEIFPEEIRETGDDYRQVLAAAGSFGLIAHLEGAYAGNAVGYVPGVEARRELRLAEAGGVDRDLVYLFNIVTMPQFQGCGLGRRLLAAFFDVAAARGFRAVGGHFRGNGSLANFKRLGGRELAGFDDWFGTGERYVYCELDLDQR